MKIHHSIIPISRKDYLRYDRNMWTLIKYALIVGAFTYGSLYAVDHIPALKAQVIEYANPAVREARLIRSLDVAQKDLINDLTVQTSKLPSDQQQKINEKIKEVRDLFGQIQQINDQASNKSLPELALKKISEILTQPATDTLTSPNPNLDTNATANVGLIKNETSANSSNSTTATNSPAINTSAPTAQSPSTSTNQTPVPCTATNNRP